MTLERYIYPLIFFSRCTQFSVLFSITLFLRRHMLMHLEFSKASKNHTKKMLLCVFNFNFQTSITQELFELHYSNFAHKQNIAILLFTIFIKIFIHCFRFSKKSAIALTSVNIGFAKFFFHELTIIIDCLITKLAMDR